MTTGISGQKNTRIGGAVTDDSLKNAYDQQNEATRTAQQRSLQQAILTRQRALQVATEGLDAELKQLGEYWKKRPKPKDDNPDV